MKHTFMNTMVPEIIPLILLHTGEINSVTIALPELYIFQICSIFTQKTLVLDNREQVMAEKIQCLTLNLYYENLGVRSLPLFSSGKETVGISTMGCPKKSQWWPQLYNLEVPSCFFDTHLLMALPNYTVVATIVTFQTSHCGNTYSFL